MGDQSDTTEASRAGEKVSSAPPVRAPRDWLNWAMWLTVVVCAGMLTWSQVRRARLEAGRQLTWVPVHSRDASVSAGDSLRGGNDLVLPAARWGPPGVSDELAAMGARLDDPGLGVYGLDRGHLDGEIPISQRWQIVLPAGLTEGQYARQLSALNIELGTLDEESKVNYVTHPGEATVSRRAGARDKEKRLYWTWDGGDLSKADGVLMSKAGLRASGNIVLHFCPKATIQKLAALEKKYKNLAPVDILLTRFSIKRTFRGYEVYVLDQRVRP